MQSNRLRLIKRLTSILIYALVILSVFLSIAPILYLAITSFKEPELTFAIPPVWSFKPTLQNYEEVLSSTDFDKYFMNSVITALSTTAIALILGTLAAYGFSRFRFRGHFWVRMSSLIPQMLPPIAIVVPLYVL
jgi:multiple sugar transport system permease protein